MPIGKAGKGPRRILLAVAQYPKGVTREQLTVLTGYKRSTRNAYLLRLEAAELVVDDGSRFSATPKGIAELGGDYTPAPTGAALLAHVRGRLAVGELAILDELIGVWPQPADREDLTDTTGYKPSTRNAYIRRLIARELVRELPDACVTLSESFAQAVLGAKERRA